MKKRAVLISLAMIAFLLSFATNCSVAENRIFWDIALEGMSMEIYAPYEANAGYTITIRTLVTAEENLQKIQVLELLFCEVATGAWTQWLTVFSDAGLSSGGVLDKEVSVTIPSNAAPGAVYLGINCSWAVFRSPNWSTRVFSQTNTYPMTTLRSRAYDELQAKYDDLSDKYEQLVTNSSKLQQDYNSLKIAYDDLLAKFNSNQNEMNVTRNALYLLGITTVAFTTASVYFFRKLGRNVKSNSP